MTLTKMDIFQRLLANSGFNCIEIAAMIETLLMALTGRVLRITRINAPIQITECLGDEWCIAGNSVSYIAMASSKWAVTSEMGGSQRL
jgi:hypothetical protein